MRRSRRIGAPEQQLDSFLDIMTNTVGVLVFVLLFVALAAADASILVRTPLLTDTEKDSVMFEVRGGRVIHIDTQAVTAEFQKLFRSLPDINIFNMYAITRRVEGFEATTQNYNVRFAGSMLSGTYGLRYRPRNNDVGTDSSDLKDPSLEYQRTLERTAPADSYVAFIVRPDSIEAFQLARNVAIKRGFQTGWEPMTEDRELIFGSGGRTIGVQ